MIRKIMVSLLTLFFVVCLAFAIVVTTFLLVPSNRSLASLSLPNRIEDSVEIVTEEKGSAQDSVYDNIYLADVHQSLTLRTQPNSNAETVIEEGLAPMTHMQLISMVDGSNFAYVEVINGNFKGKTGYVNRDYITPLGEPTLRVGEE